MRRFAVLMFVMALSLVLLSGCKANFEGCTPGSIGGLSPSGPYVGGYCSWSY